jgi:DNA primase
MASSNPISFKDLKQRISIEQVLRHYNLFDTLHLRGKSHRGPCPFCEVAEGNPFSVSLDKNCYQCFTCKASGNILDFVSRWEGVNIREAGQILTKNFVDEKAPPPAAQTVEKITEREAGPPADEAGERADNDSSAQAPAATLPQGETLSRNEPLTFALKNIEPDHPSVKALGIQEDILTAFGVGYYSGRGMMENRIVIPVYNTSRQLVAYAGFHSEEHMYTYPPKFRRELELYNLGSASAADAYDQGVILVRHPLEALMLVSAGYLNAIAIMGDTLSEEQVELLHTEYGAGERVTLFWPTHADVVPTLSALLPDFFVRLRRYEEKTERFCQTYPYERSPFVGLRTATSNPYKLTFVGVW